MPELWEADFEVSEELAIRLLSEQFPELALATLKPLGVGWDNVAFLVDGELVFRFPRRTVAVRLLERETWVLPLLASHLSLPVPVPRFVGVPTEYYPYPFAGYPILPGETTDRMTWTDEERSANAPVLAKFLAALHKIPVDDATRLRAPGDDFKVDLPARFMHLKASLEGVTSVSDTENRSVLALAESLTDTTPFMEPVGWIHGDLYPRHLLADGERRLCGVIDWGDVQLNDPALDLSIAFTFLPPEGRPTFRSAYGPIDAATWDRARFRALFYGGVLADYGEKIGDEAIRSAGLYALQNAGRD